MKPAYNNVLPLTALVAVLAGLIFTGAFFAFFTSDNINQVAITAPWTVSWPLTNAELSEWQTFVLVPPENASLDNVTVRWFVDGGIIDGEMNRDSKTFTATVDVGNWDWNSRGEYELSFIITDTLASSTELLVVPVYTRVVQPVVAVVEQTQEIRTDSRFAEQVNVAVSSFEQPNAQVMGDSTFKIEWMEGPITQNQRFIFNLSGYENKNINAFWASAGGHKNQVFPKDNSYEASINVNGWRWRGSGPYEIAFSIVDTVTLQPLAEEVFEMTWQGVPGESALQFRTKGNAVQTRTEIINTVVPPVAPRPQVTPLPVQILPPLNSQKLFVGPKPVVQRSITEALSNERVALEYIRSQAGAIWLNGDGNDSNDFISSVFSESVLNEAIPAFVLYNIPFRDCGSHSSGGAKTAAEYRLWIDRLASQFQSKRAIVVIEPDAVAQLNCAPEASRTERLELISYAVETLTKASTQVSLYIDAGHPFWVNGDEMAERLKKAGIKNARGFSLNVSNYVSTTDNEVYGTYLGTLLGGKHFVIDTSRNGNGPSPEREWCNPSGRALGENPRIVSNLGLLDAYLWIKYPGESDGSCNGGPGAGQWWKEYAVELYNNRR